MTQSIIVQVGQCGNQIGSRFWELALREHASVNKHGVYDEAIASFFQNTDTRTGRQLAVGDGLGKIKRLKARAVLIDMEEGVVNEILSGPLADVFDNKQLITDVSGCGNNWAVGHLEYGQQYREQISNVIRQAAEACDCLQCFFVCHSMGGGTGSGVGTSTLRLLQDEYPDVFRFVAAVYPSEDDDVITSPYNSLLAMRELSDAADCVMPIENQALMDIVNRSSGLPDRPGKRSQAGSTEKSKAAERPFDKMNSIVANLLLNMTSSSRFEGAMNVDLNEISMNLVPFPMLKYLVSSLSPVQTARTDMMPRKLDQMFTDAFAKTHQLLKVDPRHSLYLACALMLRGKVEISDVRRNIDRLKPTLKFVHWNTEGWKTGMCSVPPVDNPSALLLLANNTCFQYPCMDVRNRFAKLYKRKAHAHHYTRVNGFEDSLFHESLESIDRLISEYETLDKTVIEPPIPLERLRIL